jgi:hypothetical protein
MGGGAGGGAGGGGGGCGDEHAARINAVIEKAADLMARLLIMVDFPSKYAMLTLLLVSST